MTWLYQDFKNLKKLNQIIQDLDNQLDWYHQKYTRATLIERRNRTAQEIQNDFEQMQPLFERRRYWNNKRVDLKAKLLWFNNLTG